jgi:hypothetical protein
MSEKLGETASLSEACGGGGSRTDDDIMSLLGGGEPMRVDEAEGW